MATAIFGAICFVIGAFSMWTWLTELSPYAKKQEEKEYGVQVRCSHCGRMYRTGFNNVRTANFCSECG